MEMASEISFAFVEDSDEDFALFRRAFSSAGSVRRWPTGEAALKSFGDEDPPVGGCRVLVVDLHLPGIDGCEVVRRTRGLPGGGVPAIVVLSSSEASADVDRAMEAGADAFFTKPSDVQALLALPDRMVAVAVAAGR